MRVCFIPPAYVLEESVCLALDFSHCIRRKTWLLLLHPWQRSMHALQISQLLAKSYCLFYLFFSSQWAVLWHEAITSVWTFKRRKQDKAVSLDLLPYAQACAGLVALLLLIPQSCPLPCSCWTRHSRGGMKSLISTPSHHLILSSFWIPTSPNESFRHM